MSSNCSYLSSFYHYWKFKDYLPSLTPLIGTITDIRCYFAKDILHSNSTLEINLKIKLVSLCSHTSRFTVTISYNNSSCPTSVKDSLVSLVVVLDLQAFTNSIIHISTHSTQILFTILFFLLNSQHSL